MKLIVGNCIDVLRRGSADRVDAIVTDPPYGLGFMGKQWDDLPPGDEFAREALRVLKPGGHILAFGGTRTYHRLACALEDAGFEIRDCLAWLYGCLTDDVEVLTEHGWKRGAKVVEGEQIAQWEDGGVTLAPVVETFRAPWSGPMVRFRNHDTDQLVTSNHRVYHRRAERVQVNGLRRSEWSHVRVAEAATINRWQPIRLPLAGEHDGRGIGGEDYAALLGWVWSEGGFDHSGTGVRIYQSSVNADKVAEIAGLLDRLAPTHKRYDRDRTYKGRAYVETCWYFSGKFAERVRGDLPDKHPTYELLWRMTLAEKQALWRAAMLGDGSGNSFYQRDEADLRWAQTLLHLIGQRGRVSMRSNRPGGSVCVTPRPETELQHRHLQDASAGYVGDVWCVRVPSGAFLARRNGQVFVTGNSGFPKSQDVSKAIDKAAGAERNDVYQDRPREMDNAVYGRGLGVGVVERRPATDDARRWQGWGTALKPAFEPIILARKPLGERTVAANVLGHGTGALNVDGTRIESEGYAYPNGPKGNVDPTSFALPRIETPVVSHPGGRWPANVILDEESARLLDEQSGKLKSPKPYQYEGKAEDGTRVAYQSGLGYGLHSGGHGDSGGASRFFYCAKASRKERNAGVEKNDHPTVKPIALMRWLVRLVTPPGGLVVDPFNGSGTTGIACLLEGFDYVGIDLDPHYIEIAAARINHYEKELLERAG